MADLDRKVDFNLGCRKLSSDPCKMNNSRPIMKIFLFPHTRPIVQNAPTVFSVVFFFQFCHYFFVSERKGYIRQYDRQIPKSLLQMDQEIVDVRIYSGTNGETVKMTKHAKMTNKLIFIPSDQIMTNSVDLFRKTADFPSCSPILTSTNFWKRSCTSR